MRILATIILACVALAAVASRQFVETSAQFMGSTTAPVTTYPCTIAAWYKPSNTTSNHSIVYIGSTTDARRFLLYRNASGSGNVIRASAVPDGGGAGADAVGTTAVSDTARWYHVVGVFASATSRKVYVDGVPDGTNTTSITTTSLNRFAIGARGFPVPTWGVYANGKISEVSVWNVALSDSEISQLAEGANPQWIQRSSLQSYVPLCTDLSPDIDITGSTIGLTNSPSASLDHPPVFR